MEKYIYRGTDITDIINEKENRIIKLYAKENGILPEWAKDIYMRSKLKNAIRDVDNGLWMQSEYYIMEAYVCYLDAVRVLDIAKIKARKRNSKNKNNKVGDAMSQSTSGTKVKRQKKEMEMTIKK